MDINNLFPAHIRSANGFTEVQTVEEHCRETASRAQDMLFSVGLDSAGRLAGLLHDMGKCKKEFREYIFNSDGSKGKVIHTFVPVRYILDSFVGEEEDEYRQLTAELLAYAVGAHHGLFDLQGEKFEHGFDHRCNVDVKYDEARENFFKTFNEEEMAKLFDEAVEGVRSIVDGFSLDEKSADTELSFYFGMMARLISSAIIDADRIDTADYMLFRETTKRATPNWKEILKRVDSKISQMPKNSKIAKSRAKISNTCKRFGKKPGGIIRLNVPTGGGKTLSSLRYALAHCRYQGKERIIFTIPLLTILEQNADVIRKFVDDDSIILEHHSNVVQERKDGEDFNVYESALDSWNSPIIITTMVQLFNTLFSGKSSCVRRFHSLCNSVIVIDEVQTVPIKLLSMFNLAIKFLSDVCGATVVLCSATQPEYGCLNYSIPNNVPEMVPYNEKLWKVFRRTNIIDKGSMMLEEVPEFVSSVAENTNSLLIVCNTKREAAFLFNELSSRNEHCFHLSAAMCTQHRRDELKGIRESLDSGEKTICVSTQVIEAGVDISFETVIRFAAGLDSVVQSAGRCNRNGERKKPSPVYVITVIDEQLSALRDIDRSKDSIISLLEEYKNYPEYFSNDLSSDMAVLTYYNRLYSGLNPGESDFPIGDMTILDIISDNKKYCREDSEYIMNQAFKIAGDSFSVFDDNTFDVIVPYGEGAKIISKIESSNEMERITLLKKAKPYTVSVFLSKRETLESVGGLRWICDGNVAVLSEQLYHEELGLFIS